MEFDFMSFMAKAATDADERASFLADPRAYLVASGLEIPAFFEVTAVEIEGSVPTMSFSVPPMLNIDELSEEALSSISGGGGGCCCVGCAT
jgi:hypothetical protein